MLVRYSSDSKLSNKHLLNKSYSQEGLF